MKILLINNCFFRRGGSEAVFFNTADLLKKHGHEVVFFSYADEKNEKTKDREYFIEWGGTLHKIKNYFYNSDAARKLDEILTIEKPDIAHIHLMWGGINQSIFHVLKKHRVPLVHTAHDYRMVCPAYTFKNGKDEECEACGKNSYYNCIINRCNKGSLIQSAIMTAEMYSRQLFHDPIKNINGFIFVSHFCEQKHIEHNPGFSKSNRVVLYNYTNPQLELDSSKKEDYVLYYGRLSYEKGITTLIKAMAGMKNIHLKVVGTGPLEKELKNLCANEACDNIEFLGYRTGKDLFKYVRDAKYVCVPSEWYENNPMTIVESYSLGTPVIGASIGGIPEIIKEGKTGYCFESRKIEDLKTAISGAMDIPNEKYSKLCENAYEFYQKNFSAESHYKSLMKFYQDTIKKY